MSLQKSKKQILRIMAVAVLICFLCRKNVSGGIFPGQDREREVVLVIDCSGSMDQRETGSDPEKLALESAGLIIDMAEAGRTRIGLVAFSDKLEKVLTLTGIREEKDREMIREQLRELDFDYTGDTDLGLALETAMELLFPKGEEGEETGIMAEKSVVLLTDGLFDLPRAPDPAKAVALSRQKAQEALETAVRGQVRIFPALLGGFDGQDPDSAFLQELAGETGGMFFPLDEASRLPETFWRICGLLTQAYEVDVSSRQQGPAEEEFLLEMPAFSPETPGEADVLAFFDRPVHEAAVFDPEGTKKAADVQSRHYALWHLPEPAEGTWRLLLKGEEGAAADVRMLLHADWACTLKAEDLPEPEQVRITVRLERPGQRELPEDFPAGLMAEVFAEFSGEEPEEAESAAELPSEVQAEEEKEPAEVERQVWPLQWDGEAFTADIPLPAKRQVLLQAAVREGAIRVASEKVPYYGSRSAGIEAVQSEVSVELAPLPQEPRPRVPFGILVAAAAVAAGIAVAAGLLLLHRRGRCFRQEEELIWRVETSGAFRQPKVMHFSLYGEGESREYLLEQIVSPLPLPASAGRGTLVRAEKNGLSVRLSDKEVSLQDSAGNIRRRACISTGEGFCLFWRDEAGQEWRLSMAYRG